MNFRKFSRYLGLLIILTFASQLLGQNYIIIGWNDLGMHCANKDFQILAVLPPYNNMTAQVIRLGDANMLPQIVTSGIRVTYEVPGNTYSVGKTNFWSYEDKLFGISLPDNIGLKGAGLSGDMDLVTDHFFKEGIPLTPFPDNDLTNEHPYQLALLKVYDSQNNLLAQAQPVIPVSNEINCVSSGCHNSEEQIIKRHGEELSTTSTPVLCANCHADPALGTSGKGDAPIFSQAIHSQHANITNDCYKCHPGPNTQCLRGAMYKKGMTCQDCHGDLANVANTISNGRTPWLEEPSCGASQCHGSNYAEEPGKLFRQSKGHGGLYCSACHGSPHALLPTVQANDNIQNIALQGYAGTLGQCTVCHGTAPQGPGPHGLLATDIIPTPGDSTGTGGSGGNGGNGGGNGKGHGKGGNQGHSNGGSNYTDNATVSADGALFQNYPNPFNPTTSIPFSIKVNGRVQLAIYDVSGRKVATVIDHYMDAGDYTANFNMGNLPSGIYLYRLTINNGSALTKQLMIMK